MWPCALMETHQQLSVFTICKVKDEENLALVGREISVEGQPQDNSRQGPVSYSWYFLHILILPITQLSTSILRQGERACHSLSRRH